ncbi:ribosome-recycling factor, mitochondrial [Hylaeus anthracinus]|uniref:ribosome-recycling factor, mitochondrial n=1 Tax=Hylaeus anthracinus TaxID=313031 RepID=UPI0023B9F24F|nr:ribosome-recycling factor, mitochondrial [Hylaeus anthracinus]
MWSLVKLNMNLQIFLRPRILKLDICSIKHVMNVHNFVRSPNVLAVYRFSNIYFSIFRSLNLSNFNNFSTAHALFKSKDRGKDKKKLQQSVHVDLNEIAEVINVEDMMSELNKAVDEYKNQIVKYMGLRTSTDAIEDLIVKHEGSEYKLQELVKISRQPNLLVLNVDVFPQVIPDIVKVLSTSQMNLNPQQQGTTIYLSIPKVTREHREKLAKTAKAYFVKCKDNITDVRNKYVKKVKRNNNVPSDLAFKIEGYISTISREHIDKAENLLKTKQKELLGESL